MAQAKEKMIGAWAFLAGVVLAVIVGLFKFTGNWAYIVLVLLGLMIGFLNVGDKDSMTFLLASLALVIVSGMGNNTLIFISNLSPVLESLSSVLSSLLVLFVPATVIVALKTVFSIARI